MDLPGAAVVAAFLANITLGFGVALSVQNILLCFIGCLLGTVIGVLPGIGPLTTMAMVLPFTFHLGPTGALIMLSGVFYGAQYGGSTTAILVKIPGETSSVVTILDGHAMARQGRAGPALAMAAIASLFAGSVVTLLIAAAGPPLASIALLFHSADYVSVMLLGLVSAVVLAQRLGTQGDRDDRARGRCSGWSARTTQSGAYRLTMGMDVLFDGLGFVPISMGIFGLAEIIYNIEHQAKAGAHPRHGHRPDADLADLLACLPAMIRGTAVGTAFGILPGGGPTIASFSAYTLEKKVSATPERFGKGAIEGVAAPGGRQQRRRAGLLHPDAQPRHSAERVDGADDRRADGPRHPAGPEHHRKATGAVLGADRQHVDRQRDAGDPQPAADRHLGAAAAGAVWLPVSFDSGVLLHRYLRAQQQYR